MRAAFWLLAVLFIEPLIGAGDSGVHQAPSYSAASIVNAATYCPEALAPNTLATLYGENLSYTTRAITGGDVRNGRLPTVLPGTGVWVLVNNTPAFIYYVSPKQVNFLIPGNLLPGRVKLQLVRDGVAGRAVEIRLRAAAPALFQLDGATAIATRADGSLVTWDSPAQPGEMVILYATGLGETEPTTAPGSVPRVAARIRRLSEFRILLNGVVVEGKRIYYAGVTPGFGGLYQVNFWLPEQTPAAPEIRLALGDEISPPEIRLPVVR